MLVGRSTRSLSFNFMFIGGAGFMCLSRKCIHHVSFSLFSFAVPPPPKPVLNRTGEPGRPFDALGDPEGDPAGLFLEPASESAAEFAPEPAGLSFGESYPTPPPNPLSLTMNFDAAPRPPKPMLAATLPPAAGSDRSGQILCGAKYASMGFVLSMFTFSMIDGWFLVTMMRSARYRMCPASRLHASRSFAACPGFRCNHNSMHRRSCCCGAAIST